MRRVIIAASCIVFFFVAELFWKIFHDVDKTDPGVELRPLLGVVYKKDQL